MKKYLSWNTKQINDFSDQTINTLYNEGYVFGRPNKGFMNQTRSLRIDLSKFELSSENRRILRKNEDLKLTVCSLPLENYHWSIGKLAKDFYEEKFGKGTFTANKIKEMLTTDHNYNRLFTYSINNKTVGHCIALETNKILHYSYPFYNLNSELRTPNSGMSMMLKAITYAKENKKQYIYLGSAQRPGDKYKLQFTGLEWFDGEKWSGGLEELKLLLKT